MSASNKPVRFRVIPSENGLTLTTLLMQRFQHVPLRRDGAITVVKAGGVFVNNLRVRIPTVRVAEGERVSANLEASEVEPIDPASLDFVYRDENIVVINKAAGVPVAATKSTSRGTLTEALVRRLESEGISRPYVGVVHRLDQGASGLILFTVRSAANKSLHSLFLEHSIERTYRLLATGEPPQEATCDAPLIHLRSGSVRVEVSGHRGAQSATTHFRRLGPGNDDERSGTVVEAVLETGRTHQIRAHAGHLGFPIVGDLRYGKQSEPTGDEPEKLCLHAHRLRFVHPVTNEEIDLTATMPAWSSVTEQP